MLAVEILSPKQGLYVDLGIRFCWLGEPVLHTVTVYSSSDKWQTFTGRDVVD